MFMQLCKIACIGLLAIAGSSPAQHRTEVFGEWSLDRKQSTDLVTWRYRDLDLSIRRAGVEVQIVQRWHRRGHVYFVDSLAVRPGGEALELPVASQHWPANWYMGVLALPSTTVKVTGEWEKDGSALRVSSEQIVEVSQGQAVVHTTRHFQISENGKVLTLTEQRASRPTSIIYVFHRKE